MLSSIDSCLCQLSLIVGNCATSCGCEEFRKKNIIIITVVIKTIHVEVNSTVVAVAITMVTQPPCLFSTYLETTAFIMNLSSLCINVIFSLIPSF